MRWYDMVALIDVLVYSMIQLWVKTGNPRMHGWLWLPPQSLNNDMGHRSDNFNGAESLTLELLAVEIALSPPPSTSQKWPKWPKWRRTKPWLPWLV